MKIEQQNQHERQSKITNPQLLVSLPTSSRYPSSLSPLLTPSFHQFFFFSGVKLSYGTAGFRADASILESTVFRVGILAALRSLKTQSLTGLMITASHNKVNDNGVKIADPSGGMLTQEWEPFADAIANSPTPQHLVQVNIG